jgi:DNA-binding protein HU-beta
VTKQQLIDTVAGATEKTKVEIETILDSILEAISGALQSNERVVLRGFGSFIVKETKARQGRNPRTGETIAIAARRNAGFRPAGDLKEKLGKAAETVTA